MTFDILVGLAAFASLLAGAAPGLAPRDAGELAAAVGCWGEPHPPGFPFYVILGRAWTDLLPFGSVAYRLNLLSAACLAGALALMARWLARVASTGIALLVTAAFLMSPLVVSQGTRAEIFAPLALWAMGLLMILSSGHPRSGSVAALMGGLGLALHPTAALAMPGFLVLGWPMIRRAGLKAGPYVLAVGLTLYLVLPFRALAHPPLEWGAASGASGFLAHLLRSDYGIFQLMRDSTPGGSGDPPLHFMQVLGDRMGWVLAGLGVAGLAVWVRGRRRLGLALAAWAALAGPAFGWLARVPSTAGAADALLERFALLASLPLMLGAGGALAALSGRRRAIAMATLFGVSLVTASGSEGGLLRGREAFWAEDFARVLLRSVEPGGVVLSKWDDAVFGLRHEQIVRGARRDVAVVMPVYLHWHAAQAARLWPGLAPPLEAAWTPEASVLWSTRLLASAAVRGPAYRAGDLEIDEAAFRGYEFRVSGLLERVVRAGAADLPPYMATLAPRSPLSTRLCSGFDRGLVESYAAIANRAGVQAARARRRDEAVRWFRTARMWDPASPVYRENLRRAHGRVDAH